MDDYIKREDAENTMYTFLKQAHDMDNNDDRLAEVLTIAKNVVHVIPSADVAPVRHGRWIVLQQTSMPTMWNCKCSECGAYETKTPKYQANYCPNCGAKMDEGKDNED